jgi:hypothetical protein
MAAHAGEPAWKTGTFICESCGEAVRVRRGAKIPECPGGHRTFSLRIEEPVSERELRGHPHHGGAGASQSRRAAMSSDLPRWRVPDTGPERLTSSRVSKRRISKAEARARVRRHKPTKLGD